MKKKGEIKPVDKLVEAIRNIPEPTVVREPRKFLDMFNFYRHLVPEAAKIIERPTK